MADWFEERRSHGRFPCGLAVSCRAVAGGKAWSGWASDVSNGGMCLRAERRFEQGTLLRIQIRPGADADTALPLARVVHVRATGDGKWVIGCQFARTLGQEDLAALLGPAGAWLASR